VSVLDKQPIFLTMRSVRTVTADGTEIRNYVNGASVSSCGGGGDVFSGTVNSATYDDFSSCIARAAASNNIFYVKDGIVKNIRQSDQAGRVAIRTHGYGQVSLARLIFTEHAAPRTVVHA
jgi:hypothetical protein